MTSRLSIDAASVPSRLEGDSDALSLTADDRFVLDSVDGMSSVEELAMMLAMNEESIIRSLTKLTQSRLVRIGDEAEGDAPEASQAETTTAPTSTPPPMSARAEGAAPDAHAPPGRGNHETADFEVADLLDRLKQQEQADTQAAASGSATDDSPGTLRITTPAAILELRDAHRAKPRFDLQSGERIDAPSKPPEAPTVRNDTVPGTTGAQRPVPPPGAAPKAPASDRLPTPKRPIPPPYAAAPTPTGRVNVDTPRTNLDRSWWGSAEKLEEPDEGLTAREISHSGLSNLPSDRSASRELRLPSPNDPLLLDDTLGDAKTKRLSVDTPPSGVYPRQHLERPPGGFIAASGTTANQGIDARDTSRVDVLPTERADLDTAELDAVDERDTAEQKVLAASSSELDDTAQHDTLDEQSSDTAPFFVDEVAHTRDDASVPLLPDARTEDGWGDMPTPIVDQSGERPWASQSVEPSLAETNGGWTSEDAKAVSFYLQQIQSGTYYEIFAVANDAAPEAIEAADTATRARLRLSALSAQADTHGKLAVESVKRGLDRALEVLKNPAARAQYDAALEALAAFKL